ncbi:hypothetical protein WDZ92_45910, partial [Nostoc sp. NIES-2111]
RPRLSPPLPPPHPPPPPHPASAAAFPQQGDSPRDTRLPVSEHAAWMLASSQVLNLDAALTKE